MKVIRMTFVNQGGNKVSITVDNANDSVTPAEVKNAMQLILTKNIFSSTGGDFASIDSAEIVDTQKTELAVK